MGFDLSLTRKELLTGAVAGAAGAMLPFGQPGDGKIDAADLQGVEDLAALEFSKGERLAALGSARGFRQSYEQLRDLEMGNAVPPSLNFLPDHPGDQTAIYTENGKEPSVSLTAPTNGDDIAFLTVRELAHLIETRQISPVELTQLYLDRLEKYSPRLLNVITLLPEKAMAQARRAEKEIEAGNYRGPLHGIPYGIKDLFDTEGDLTTYGAEPFMDRVAEQNSTVAAMLERAGAILLAKLSLGALAMNDHWFKGRTRNPWNPDQGSSGSSAGSASATAAGLVGFSIGTETLGSIMSPSHRNRVTGLRPTFGRVSRAGAMALSWSMDKVGPICRSADCCALVLRAINGMDPADYTTREVPFAYPIDTPIHIGYLAEETGLGDEDPADETREWLKVLRALGYRPDPIEVPRPIMAALFQLSVEAAAAFDEITRDGRVNEIKNSSWPGIFRAHRYVPAVEYLQAVRARSLVMEQFKESLYGYDMIAASGRGSHLLYTTNLTGHPQLYIPTGLDGQGRARGLSLIGQLWGEGPLCTVGKQVQDRLQIHRKRPELIG